MLRNTMYYETQSAMKPLDLVFILLFSFFTVSVFGQCLVSPPPPGLLTFNPTEDIGQGFTAECSGNLEYVEIYSGGPGAIAAGTLNIYSGNSVSPANLIYTQTHPAMTIAATGDPIRFDLTSPLQVVLNSQYTFQFNVAGVSIVATANYYAGGTAFEDVRTLPQFDIPFTASIVNPSSPLLITQYYEGTGNDKWLEIKNISSNTVNSGEYYIGLFEDSFGTIGGGIETNTPISYQINFAIPPGEVVLFGHSGATAPAPANRGPTATVINDGTADAICAFTGDDIIIISTTNDGTAYDNRTDIVGVVGAASTPVDWGTDLSIIKGGGTTEEPAIIYDPVNVAYDANEFIQLELATVVSADPTTNIALGTQTVGATTWTTGWSNGVPDKTKNVVIDGTYIDSDGSLEARNLTINTGASINLDSGGTGSNYVLVAKDLTVDGSLTIGDTEALITTDPNAIITGSMTKIERTTPLNNFRDYTYWSSPVNTTIEAAFVSPSVGDGVDPNRIFQWRTPVDQSSPTAGDGDPGNWEIASGTMQEGRGYLAEAPASLIGGQQHQVNFIGTPNNGTINVPVGLDTGQAGGYGGYNIIGNPYPSAINIDLFIEAVVNSEIDADPTAIIDGTIWLWSHSTQIDGGTTGEFNPADYVSYNLAGGVSTTEGTPAPTNIIGSGQGFLVQVFEAGNNELTFENSMRVTGQNDTQFFKSDKKVSQEKDRVWLNMTNNKNDFNQILIGFFDKATDSFDRGYDGLSLNSGNIIFYSMIEDNIYAIQGFGEFDLAREIPLGFYAATEGTHNIAIDKVEGILADQEMYLVDNELNTIHDLKQGSYAFEVLTAGNYKERFIVKFNSGVLSTTDVEIEKDNIIYPNPSTDYIRIGGLQREENYTIFNQFGIKVKQGVVSSGNKEIDVRHLKAGLYIVSIDNRDGIKFIKK